MNALLYHIVESDNPNDWTIVWQVMSKAQLPLLTSVIMVTQAFISAPAGIRAKRSLRDRNQVLLLGYAAMIAADLTFAFMPTVYGEALS